MQEAEIFFKLFFGPTEGYICLGFLRKGNFSEEFYKYPDELNLVRDSIIKHGASYNVYFCAQLLSKKKRNKAHTQYCTVAWADLDTCEPENMLVEPSIVIQSSPGRWQAYWMFEEPLEPELAENLSKRIAYYHAFQGCDRSGWDLTQLLRVPYTINFKYPEEKKVEVVSIKRTKYRLSDFEKYPPITSNAADDFPFPEGLDKTSGQDVIDRYVEMLPVHAQDLFSKTPVNDWSTPLWSLEMLGFEAGMTKEEVYCLVRDAACNKYKRDDKSPKLLWNDVCRSYVKNEENKRLNAPTVPKHSLLLTEAERASIAGRTSFIDRYIAWASSLGDAAVQYHQAGAFVILSALISGGCHLPTSFGSIKPNVWFMLLADTTLTRKSTAMDIAIDLLNEVDSSPLLATDGSVEGLLGGLSTRPGQPSIFLRDEFSGFLEQLIKKDYNAGMAETLTKLYDGKLQKRLLRKETIEIREPTLILFTGGILNKVTALLTHEFVSSGFIPRFIFITAESDTDKIRAMGPPTNQDTTQRDELLHEMRGMFMHYHKDPQMVMTVIQGRPIMKNSTDHIFKARLSESAWERYNGLERDMMNAGVKSPLAEIMTPTYDRLCKSALRYAVLLAASEQRPDDGAPVFVELEHILTAIRYAEEWRGYVDQVIRDIGHTQDERQLERILVAIKKSPGISRSSLMQNFHLNARSASNIFETLYQRGQIIRTKVGKGETFAPNG